MKRTIISALAALAVFAAAAKGTKAPADTTWTTSEHVERIITDETTNTKGKTVVNFYAVMKDGRMLKTNRTTADAHRVATGNSVTLKYAVINNRRLAYQY